MPEHKDRVLVTGGDYVGVLGTIRALRASYDPCVAVYERDAYAAHSRAAAGVYLIPDPTADAERFADALAELSDRLSAAAILPGTEVDLLALATYAERFPAGTTLGVPPLEVVERALDKDALTELAMAAGLETPLTRVLSADEPIPGEMSYPAMVKPLRSHMSTAEGDVRQSCRRVQSDSELAAALADLPRRRGLVQEFVGGRLGAVCGVFWEGRIVTAVHQVASRVWPHDRGEMAYASTVEPDFEFDVAVGRMLCELGWRGLFQLQYIEQGDRRFLIDLNPRIYASIALAVAAGTNLPEVWVDLLLGHDAHPRGYAVGVRFRREELDFRALLALAARGQLLAAVNGLVPRPRTAHAVFDHRDARPLLTTIGNLSTTLQRRISARAEATLTPRLWARRRSRHASPSTARSWRRTILFTPAPQRSPGSE